LIVNIKSIKNENKFMNGFVTQIIGPVVDVEFPEGQLPGIYNALEILKGKQFLFRYFLRYKKQFLGPRIFWGLYLISGTTNKA
jgi:hypothetical protein